jgi:hypothetical protein
MKKQGVKTIGFLGYTDAYGELWLKALTAEAEKNGMKIVAVERFARTDTSVTPQALKLTSPTPTPCSSWPPAPVPPCRKRRSWSAATRARSTRRMPRPRPT